MDKENLIELTNKIYKITLLFPKKEPLRYKIREKADDISANFVTLEALRNFNPGNLATDWEKRYKDSLFLIGKDLEILKSYFETAKWQNWVSYFDVLEIQEQYGKIKDNLEKEGLTREKSLKIEFPVLRKPNKIDRGPALVAHLDMRKEKILEVLKEKGRVQVWQVKEVFPQVTKRTLRRDFEKLLKQGLIERMGERNNTFYQINPVRDSEDSKEPKVQRISNGVKES